MFSPQPLAGMKAFCHGLSWVASVRQQARMQCSRWTQIEEIVTGCQLDAKCRSFDFLGMRTVRWSFQHGGRVQDDRVML